MTLVDAILNLAGLLLWLSWRTFKLDPVTQAQPASLAGTLRRAEPRRLQGWLLLAGLGALLFFRAVLYWQIGSPAGWHPHLALTFVVLVFRTDYFGLACLYSLLSFACVLLVFYFWLLAIVVAGRGNPEGEPIQRVLRLRLGMAVRAPWPLQVVLPFLIVVILWVLIHPLLARAGLTERTRSLAHVVEQGLLVGMALYLSLKYLIPPFLFMHLVASYVYLGKSPVWEFISGTARNFLAPLRGVPTKVGRVDFAPLVGIVLVLLLLHGLPNWLMGQLLQRGWSIWPQ